MNTLVHVLGAKEALRRLHEESSGFLSEADKAAAAAQGSLAEFIRQAWHLVEPGTPLTWGRHIDAICENLQAVTFGQLRRLLINIPPGHSKSLITGVFWPAWIWLHKPEWRILCASYGMGLAIRDAMKCRLLVESDWYRDSFKPDWKLTKDQNAKSFYQNTKTGFRVALSVDSQTTGWRGNLFIFDDLLNVKDSHSETMRQGTNDWLDLSASNRLSDMRTGALVMIAQRLHDEDPCGHVLSQGGWQHLCLPSRFEPERAYKTHDVEGKVISEDWRSEPGELLFPQFFTPEVIDNEEKRLGPLGFAGQHQQYPTPAEGNLFKAEMFCPNDGSKKFWSYPSGKITEAYLSFDTATKAKTQNDYTAGCASLYCTDGFVYVVPLMLERIEAAEIVHKLALFWAYWKTGRNAEGRGSGHPALGEALKSLRIEDNGAGAVIVQYARRLMVQRSSQSAVPSPEWTQAEWDLVRSAPPLIVNPYTSKEDKVARAMNVLPFVQGRAVRLVDNDSLAAPWLQTLQSFPLAVHDDAVDATVAAIERFAGVGEKRPVIDDEWVRNSVLRPAAPSD